jgi:hypothetical protein
VKPKHSQQFDRPDWELRWREPRRDYGVINAPKFGKCQRIFGSRLKKMYDGGALSSTPLLDWITPQHAKQV